MSDYRNIAAWCEYRSGRPHAVSTVIVNDTPAFYPSNDIELGRAMVREVLTVADGRDREEHT